MKPASGPGAPSLPTRPLREIVCALCAALFAHYLMHYHLAVAVQLPFAGLDELLAGTAPRPFCYRLLSPSLIQLAGGLGLAPHAATALLEWGSLFVLYYLFRGYLAEFLPTGQAAYSALSIFFVLPFVFIVPQPYTVWFPWDFPSLCFFTGLLWIVSRRAMHLWYPVFFLATLNRETTIFLLPLLARVAWRDGWATRWRVHLVATAGLWALVKGALALWFRDRAGPALVEWSHQGDGGTHWRENLSSWSEPAFWPYLLSAVGFLWILVLHLRRFAPPPLRDAQLILPGYVLGVFLFGNVVEHRVFGDLIPVLLAPLLVWHGSFRGATERA